MSYAQYGKIQASDFNDFVGSDPTTVANKLNSVWGIGGINSGYGQSNTAPVPTVSVDGTIEASDWANLINTISNLALHQASSITSVTAPSAGDTITYQSAIATNLQTVYNNRLNATSQGMTSASSVTYNFPWANALVFTHTVTFTDGDSARYFFNSGGQLKIVCSHANNDPGINLLVSDLASNVGNVVISAPSSGTEVVGGVTFNGVTKIGGGGNSPTISQNNGYYALSTSNANVFSQTASTGPALYLGTNISVLVKSNGTQGSNGDTGSVITIYTVWDETPDGLTVGSGSTTSLVIAPPETTYIANTWGTISAIGSVTGS